MSRWMAMLRTSYAPRVPTGVPPMGAGGFGGGRFGEAGAQGREFGRFNAQPQFQPQAQPQEQAQPDFQAQPEVQAEAQAAPADGDRGWGMPSGNAQEAVVGGW